MRVIIPDRLWIANALQVRDLRAVLATGTTAIVDLAIEEKPVSFPRDITSLRFPLLDGEGNDLALLKMAVDAVAGFIEARRPTTVACSAGMSRSPGLVAAALAQVEGQSLEDTVLRIAETGPCDLSPGLLSDLLKLVPPRPVGNVKPNLVILRSLDLDQLCRSYQMFGLAWVRERHGKGPEHFSTTIDDFVLELYPARSAEHVDATTGLGFRLNDIAAVVEQLRLAGTRIVREPESMPWGLQAIVQDPDGRSVILTQPA
ncbi:VOC family protein [Blastopirellula marina]|uniref:VOC domain-containing protein n=1 Tax=Blastopirellula marina TaxID=124 RepID=A0A2S8G259_9BACT|nr:VOC family protein [Blastopirellula marina]PQO38535.1 hypothetical protein C5Y98_10830 [Blastopirellula marina]PTL45192.1 hypothetical protein C5Y97_10840 [Blastopirellula marina]